MSENNPFEQFEEAEQRPFNREHFVRMLGYLRSYKRAGFLTGVGILLAAGVPLFEPYLLGKIVDDGIVPGNVEAVRNIAIMMAVLQLFAWIGRRTTNLMAAVIGQGTLFDLREDLFTHIQKLSLRFYDKHPVGRIMSRITSDVESIARLLNTGLVTFVGEGVTLIGIIIVMLWMSWQLTLVAFVTMPFLAILLYIMRTSLETSWKNVRKSVSNINTYTNESVNGIQVTQAFVREEHNINKFEGLTQDSHNAFMSAVKSDELIWPVVDFIGVVGTSLVIIVGGAMVLNETLTLGFVIAFIYYVWRFWQPLSAMSRLYGMTLSAMASAERIFFFIDTAPEITNKPNAKSMPHIIGRVAFEKVFFKYDSDQEWILNDIEFRVAPGETIALVGHTGSGKTSIINLLMRFYDPIEGMVRIDGHDLRDVEVASLRSQMAMVLQDGFAFSGTIADNIRYGKLDATDEEIEVVAKAVHLDEFVQTLDDKYATDVGERGNRLSVGQRQLVAFARALLADPRILILDEATSSVDTETEQRIQQAMVTLREGRTAFVIAHRLSTIRHADRIMVIDHGRILEYGTHQELLALRGRYFDLYLTQFADQPVLNGNGNGVEKRPLSKPVLV
ncbi:MAG: ABC transporter ATP-binding protein [Anaerolineales bacterium]|nr:ABC transporter ATP-binding protein [Anaerolineales bacterium]